MKVIQIDNDFKLVKETQDSKSIDIEKVNYVFKKIFSYAGTNIPANVCEYMLSEKVEKIAKRIIRGHPKELGTMTEDELETMLYMIYSVIRHVKCLEA